MESQEQKDMKRLNQLMAEELRLRNKKGEMKFSEHCYAEDPYKASLSRLIEERKKSIEERGIVLPGTEILRCKPFVFAAELVGPGGEKLCDTCFVIGGKEKKLRLCSACHVVSYCDRTCQALGWKNIHKYECKGLKKVPKDCHCSLEKSVRLLVGILGKLQDGKGHFQEVQTANGIVKRRFQDLTSRLAQLTEIMNDEAKSAFLRNVINNAMFILQEAPEIKLPNPTEILLIACKMLTNAIYVGGKGLGIPLAVYLAELNHSCEPNGHPRFKDGCTIVIRSIQELPVGLPIDKITTPLCNLMIPSCERRKDLWKKSSFDCQCEKCRTFQFDKEMRGVICRKEGCNAEVNTADLKFGRPCPSCGYKFSEKEAEEILKTEKMYIEALGSTLASNDCAMLDAGVEPEIILAKLEELNFSENHWLVTNLHHEAFKINYESEKWSEAYSHGLKCLEGMRRCKLPVDSGTMLILVALAQLDLGHLDKLDEAEEYLNEAKKLLDFIEGDDAAESKFYINAIHPLERKIEIAKLKKRLGLKDGDNMTMRVRPIFSFKNRS